MGNNVPYSSLHSSNNKGWTEVLSALQHPLSTEENCHWQNRFKCSLRTWSFQSFTVRGHVHLPGRSFCHFFAVLSQMDFWVKLYYHTKKDAYIKLFSIYEYRNELSRMLYLLKCAWMLVLPSWWTIRCCFFAEAGNIAVIQDSLGFLLILAILGDGGRTMKVPLWFSYYVTFVHWLKGE